ncbi:MAG TPA: hypothetical protein VFP65_08910 [Anaeromyxobacteraceae bacterium]|nr:hypothetical protein [Anaeromyxobacteraceae bacterium]
MRARPRSLLLALALSAAALLFPAAAAAQAEAPAPGAPPDVPPAPTPAPPAPVPAATPSPAPAPPEWTGRASASLYFLPHDTDYILFTGAADRGPLHLEARYNYEDRRTLSLWAGFNWSTGDELALTLVPMFGAVLGNTNGIAPGLELTLEWGPLTWYVETEVVVDLGNTDASYFYAWSELSAKVPDGKLESLRGGVVIQRTRAFQQPRDVVPGLLVGYTVGRFELSAYWFWPGGDGQYAALSVGTTF